MAAFIAALEDTVQIGIRTMRDLIERRFARFARVPYQDPLCREQWEELWETEAEL
jgi:hypothetical protein